MSLLWLRQLGLSPVRNEHLFKMHPCNCSCCKWQEFSFGKLKQDSSLPKFSPPRWRFGLWFSSPILCYFVASFFVFASKFAGKIWFFTLSWHFLPLQFCIIYWFCITASWSMALHFALFRILDISARSAPHLVSCLLSRIKCIWSWSTIPPLKSSYSSIFSCSYGSIRYSIKSCYLSFQRACGSDKFLLSLLLLFKYAWEL